MNSVGSDRTRAYSTVAIKIFSAQAISTHSQTTVNPSSAAAAKASPSSSICSLTTRKSASLRRKRASRSSIDSSVHSYRVVPAMSIRYIDGGARRIWVAFKLLGDFPCRADLRDDYIALVALDDLPPALR